METDYFSRNTKLSRRDRIGNDKRRIGDEKNNYTERENIEIIG
jgi:hypothetical protein